MEEMELTVEKWTFSSPLLPFLVVIIITPLEARDPYIAVAEASFNIVKDAMLCELIKLKGFEAPEMPALSKGTPSSTINGLLFAFNEAPPLIRILDPVPG